MRKRERRKEGRNTTENKSRTEEEWQAQEFKRKEIHTKEKMEVESKE